MWPYFLGAGVAGMCLYALFWLLLTRHKRACELKTCTYYARYVPSFPPGETVPLEHHIFHVNEQHLRVLQDSANYRVELGMPLSEEMVSQLRKYKAIVRN